jgi:uncharacterized membrane protein (UPF0127 family)
VESPARASLRARARIAAAVVVAIGALIGMVVLVVHVRADESGIGRLSFATPRPAAAPFGEFSEAHVSVGSRCVRVLVALSPSQRTQGLTEVRSLGPYAGMLFVTRGDTTERFTMADTFIPLDITFFAADGAPVDRLRMAPCPKGTDATCPEYASRTRYRYALEQPPGPSAASGALASCAG